MAKDRICECANKNGKRIPIEEWCSICNFNIEIYKAVRHANRGFSKHPLMGLWGSMLTRCYHPTSRGYRLYGAKGISICDRWLTFQNFVYDVESSRKPGLSLDRYPDLYGNYGPDNFRWATSKQQNNNKSNNVFIDFYGERLTLTEVAEKTGIAPATIRGRMRAGDTGDRLFRSTREKIVFRGETITIQDLSKITGIKEWILYHRISNENMSPEEAIKNIPKTRRPNILIDFEGIQVSLPEISKETGIAENTLRARYDKGLRGKELLEPPRDRSKVMHWWKGELLDLSQLANLAGMSKTLLYNRLNIMNMPLEKAMNTPKNWLDPKTNKAHFFRGEFRSIQDISDLTGLGYPTLYKRIIVGKMSPEKAASIPLERNKNTTPIIKDEELLWYRGYHITLLEFSKIENMPLVVAKYRYARLADAKYILDYEYDNRFHEFEGRCYSISELHLICGIPHKVLFSRINKHGWSVERAMSEPVNDRMPKKKKRYRGED